MSRQGSGDRSSWVVPIIIALITTLGGILVALINNPDILERFSTPAQQAADVQPSFSEQEIVDNAESSLTEQEIVDNSESSNEPDTADSSEPPTDCVLTITNELVSLMSEPDTFSQEIIRVPSGEYPTSDFREIPFGGTQQGWFQIEAEGRTGWVKNDTWTVENKTSACP